ncbi:hypothetical protein [Gilliamella sp. Nev3-1]|uniref:hypothetical protein n=1 Tax=Gilliamella sp. Nev3-1 TaxID=3120250 RepID=UPI00080E1D19|nr:hypothetical protein [Gilliamella apicola]OCG59106.1 hypothetical protein A9G40_00550 [Gilliamella apicola]
MLISFPIKRLKWSKDQYRLFLLQKKKDLFDEKNKQKNNNMTLENWIIKKLNSDVKIVYKKVKLQKDISKGEQWFIRLSMKPELKGY